MLDFERLLNDAENGVLPALKFLGDIYLNGYKENAPILLHHWRSRKHTSWSSGRY